VLIFITAFTSLRYKKLSEKKQKSYFTVKKLLIIFFKLFRTVRARIRVQKL